MGRRQHGQYLFYVIVIVLALLYLRQFVEVEGFEDVAAAAAAPSRNEDSTVPMKVFMYADKWKPTAIALANSLKKHKYSYEVLGLGKPWGGWIERTKVYLAAIQAYKAEKGGEAVALFLDAYDIICIKDSDIFFASYEGRARSMPVIFGAERNCNASMCNKRILEWYDYNEVEGGKAAVERQINTYGDGGEHLWSQRPVFTNNGTMMGTADGLEFLFTEILKTGIADDQVAAGKVIEANLDKFDIDVEEALFRNKFRELDKLPDEDGVSGPGFLHFHAMRSDEQQEEVLRRFQAYS
jgi:hypothetical protein